MDKDTFIVDSLTEKFQKMQLATLLKFRAKKEAAKFLALKLEDRLLNKYRKNRKIKNKIAHASRRVNRREK